MFEEHRLRDGRTGFHCAKCDYTCATRFLFKQHVATKKHRLRCPCGRSYRHVQSYRRHAAKCSTAIQSASQADSQPEDGPDSPDADSGDAEKRELRSIIRNLADQNRTILLENQKMQSVVREMLPKIGSNNTTFNLQVFLNEECKDAINLSDFVDTLKLEAGDLDRTRELGYAGGVANILVRGLQQMDVHRRPIHCSDLQRQTLFVRDRDAWEQGEDGRGRLKVAISTVAHRQTGKIKDWEADNPNWNQTDEGTQRYIEMVRSVTDGGEDGGADSKIITSIAKEVDIGNQVVPVS
tara:strand:- start:39 stop:923 length:885 start_codon:yes stop_codon:yes gene_type:complete